MARQGSVISPAQLRWGAAGEPSWENGSESTAPGAGTALVTKTVTAGKTLYLYGFHLCSAEGNEFRIYVDSTVNKRYAMQVAGVLDIVMGVPLLTATSGQVVTIKTVNGANAGMVYQASLLYYEA